MEIGEIISDAIRYPINNVKAVLIYIVLAIIATLILVITGVGIGVGVAADNVLAAGALGFIGIIIAFLIFLLIDGYMLDVIKFGIERKDDAPTVDIARQILNGIKLIIVQVVYFIIPFIVFLILSQINGTLALIVGLILFIIFGFALVMGECRLANTESLGHALNIGEAINDVTRVGIVKILAVLIICIIIAFVLFFIAGIFTGIGGSATYIGAILQGIFSIYVTFVGQRATGLLYSDA